VSLSSSRASGRAAATPSGGAASDEIGARTLARLAGAERLNAWIYGQLRPGVAGEVLEVGCGLGSMSRFIVADARQVVLADRAPEYLEALRLELGAAGERVTVIGWDLDEPPPAALAARRFDAIVAINVLEHVTDDGAAVRALAALLRPGGRLLIYVPACPFAFGALDEGLEHRRRYDRRTLGAVLSAAGLSSPPAHYMNRLGLAGWLWVGRVSRRRAIPAALIDVFERLVPLARVFDVLTGFVPAGLGLVARATKPE